MESRYLLIRKGCPFCRDNVRIISKLNLRLPVEKRIRIVDCYEWEEFGLKNIPIMKLFDKVEIQEGFPFLYIDGIIINPAPTPEQLNIFLKTFLKEDLL